MSTLSTHILDVASGKPAQGVVVRLIREGDLVASATTDAQGRIPAAAFGECEGGCYQLVAEIGDWFARHQRDTLYTQAQIDAVLSSKADEHYHLPFLIAPGGWSTYRGS
ncbi:hydroxyisourate hydrolase [Carnimonas bestiolae]|uniref:hydroxyisourate hydrolase n=1 Tax=Carnimonas bestiolae TaxID=3402172 RepID=UPI003EDB9EF8